MAITVIEPATENGKVLNREAYVLQTDSTDRTVQISVQVFVETSPPYSGNYEFVFQKDLPVDEDGSATIFLDNLEAVLDFDLPDLSAIVPVICPLTSRRYKIQVGEKVEVNDELVSENYIESSNAIETVPLDNALVSGEDYLVVVETEEEIGSGDLKFRSGASTQNLNNPIVIANQVWIYETASAVWDEIDIPTFKKVSVYLNPIKYTELTEKFMLNGGEDTY